LYLAPFDDSDIDKYIRRRFPFWRNKERQKAKEIATKLPDLSVRPMLLAYIPELMLNAAPPRFTYELYALMINAWIRRESAWASTKALMEVSEELAVNLYVRRQERGMERIPENELEVIARAKNIPLRKWQITGRSLLNRDAFGNYKFAHRSIMEFLFVYRLLSRDKRCYNHELDDQMKKFMFDIFNAALPLPEPRPTVQQYYGHLLKRKIIVISNELIRSGVVKKHELSANNPSSRDFRFLFDLRYIGISSSEGVNGEIYIILPPTRYSDHMEIVLNNLRIQFFSTSQI
jgi:hypothetical protein